MGKGKEINKLLLGIFTLGIILITLTLLFTSLYAVGQINHNANNIESKVVSQLVDYFKDNLASTTSFAQSGALSGYNPSLVEQALAGNPQKLVYFVLRSLQETYSAEYLSIVSDGKVVGVAKKDYVSDEEVIANKDFPSEGYQVLTSLGGKQGVFISVFQPLNIPLFGGGNQYINMVIDRTEQLSGLEKIYTDQRNKLVNRQIILFVVVLVVAAFLSFFVIRLLVKRYILDPITDLNRRAGEIIEGTYSDGLEVVEGSAYAPLQRLIQSGSMVFSRKKGEGEADNPD